MLRKLYNWVLHCARTPQTELALFLIAFAESSVFPLPPDILLIAIVLSHREKWIRTAFICLLGSVLGGMLGYAIGWGAWQAVDQWFFRYVFSEASFQKVMALYVSYDFWIVFTAAFTPIPYKVFTIASGVFGINFLAFVTASLFGRGGRFFLVAALLRAFGAPIRSFIDRYFNWLTYAFAAFLIGGFFVLKYLR